MQKTTIWLTGVIVGLLSAFFVAHPGGPAATHLQRGQSRVGGSARKPGVVSFTAGSNRRDY